ncbi:MAG: hypothetical protein HQ488_02550 [Parcubacteria group bacterium]|nr:hypothetical protein [Parcubacteria group bacterium]
MTLVRHASGQQTLSKKDHALLGRLDLPEYLIGMIREYWLSHPKDEGKSIKISVSELVGYCIGLLLIPALLAGVLSPLYLDGASWLVNLTIFLFWLSMMILSLGMGMMSLEVIEKINHDDRDMRDSIMERGTVGLLVNEKRWRMWILRLILLTLLIAVVVQAHFVTAMGLIIFGLGFKFWAAIHKGLIQKGLNQISGVEIINPS